MVVLVAGGCAPFEDPAPREARLVLDGDVGASVRVVAATRFVARIRPNGRTQVDLATSDTLFRTLPFDTVYALGAEQRIFAEGRALQKDLLTFRMQVFLDGEVEFDVSGPLLRGSPLRFVYSFNQLLTPDIDVR